MKKTLRGKRHIRTRKIVAVTRVNKRIKKLAQAIKVVNRTMETMLRKLFSEVLQILSDRKKEA